MNVIDEIAKRLQKYPHVKSRIDEHQATIFPLDENGFEVTIIDNAPGYTVYFDSWHEEFDDAERAFACFVFGLSDDCRLRVDYRGNFAHAWTVEEMDADSQWSFCEWIGCAQTGLLVFPFWLKPRHAYLQNRLLKSGKVTN